MKKYKCMLIVDDDEDSCYLVKCYQERMRLASNFYTFNTGQEALAFIKHTSNNLTYAYTWPDLILLDINMPVMDGFDFLEEFNSLLKPEIEKPKIFILTNSQNPHDMKRAGKFDVDGYLVKPLTKNILNYLVEE